MSGRARVDSTPLDRVEGTFDLVLANLLLPVMEELGPSWSPGVAPGGAIVVGGLLEHQLDRAVAALGVLVGAALHRDGEWVAAVLRRDGSPRPVPRPCPHRSGVGPAEPAPRFVNAV